MHSVRSCRWYAGVAAALLASSVFAAAARAAEDTLTYDSTAHELTVSGTNCSASPCADGSDVMLIDRPPDTAGAIDHHLRFSIASDGAPSAAPSISAGASTFGCAVSGAYAVCPDTGLTQVNAFGLSAVDTITAAVDQHDSVGAITQHGVDLPVALNGGNGADTLNGGDAGDVLDGGNGADTLYGGPADDSLTGDAGSDRLYGNAGADSLDGGSDDDLLDGGAGTDTKMLGGDGNDTVDYSDERPEGEAVKVTLGPNTPSDDGGDSDGAEGARETVQTVENAIGGSGDDTLGGSPAANVLQGGAGNDKLSGFDGDDTLEGGTGDDKLGGGGAADRIDGGDGTDTVDYSTRTDPVTLTLDAGTADDGDDSDVSATDPAKKDDLVNVEDVIGGDGDDSITGNAAANDLKGGKGNDNLDGAGGDDAVTGGEGDDTLAGGEGNDTLTGGPGTDSFMAGAGDDSVLAKDQTPEPTVDCGDGNDSAEADAGDTLTGCETVTVETQPGGGGTRPTPIDADGDGFPKARDCNDNDDEINPDADEIPGNSVDENCDSIAAPYPRVGVSFKARFDAKGSTTVRLLAVLHAPKHAKVRVICKSPRKHNRGCPFKSKALTVKKKGTFKLTQLFARLRLPDGTKLILRVSAAKKTAVQTTLKPFAKRQPKTPKIDCVDAAAKVIDCTTGAPPKESE